MQNARSCAIGIMLVLSLVSLPALGANTPHLVNVQSIKFGSLIFLPGACELNYDTGIISNLPGSTNCSDVTGKVGLYRIYATPNTTVSFRVHGNRDDDDRGIVFLPKGRFASDAEIVEIQAEFGQQIDSGASGIINIRLGGILTITRQLSPSSNYAVGSTIEWSEQP